MCKKFKMSSSFRPLCLISMETLVVSPYSCKAETSSGCNTCENKNKNKKDKPQGTFENHSCSEILAFAVTEPCQYFTVSLSFCVSAFANPGRK